MSSSRWLLVVLGFIGGLAVASFAGSLSTAQAPPERAVAPVAFKSEDPGLRGLDANLYMQTSAEYRACCYQAFNLASARLREALVNKPDKPAVVLDLDETVLDNSGFQASQLRSNLAYDPRLWDIWEERYGANLLLIPGAKDFIAEAKKLGVTVVFISNRNERNRAALKISLDRLGLAITDEKQLLLATNISDKTPRRQIVEKDFQVLLYIGDNLRDFAETFRTRDIKDRTPDELEQAILERKNTVDVERQKFGTKWIILPNPAYGEWMKPLGQGRADLDRLVPEPKKN
jgi:5'-nucleotidase (lipoprotein e(P4) family)